MSNEKGLMRFSKGDIDAAVGVFFDGFSKIIIGASVLMGVLKMPSDFVFGKLVAAIGLTALIFLGWNTVLAQKTGKATDYGASGRYCCGNVFYLAFRDYDAHLYGNK